MAKKQPSTNPEFIEPRRPLEFNEKQITMAFKKGNLLGTYKVDGVRLHITFSGGQVHIWSRAKLPFPGLARYTAAAYPESLEGFTVEAEARTFDTNGNYKNAAETSGDLQRTKGGTLDRGKVVLNLFDFHDEALRDQPYSKRLKALIAIWLTVRLTGLDLGFSQITFPVIHQVTSLGDVKALYEAARILGYEGAVITADVPYSSGKKVASGWKIKPEETFEATVTGFIEVLAKDGTPKSQVGSFEVTFEDGTEGRINAGSLTHIERAEVWFNQEAFKGRLCEANAMERTEDGKARHGSFHRWRDTAENKGVKV